MIFDPHTALTFSQALISIAIVLQSVELVMIRSVLNDSGIWRWNTIRRDFSTCAKPLRLVLDLTLGYRGLMAILVLRILLGGLLFAHSVQLLELSKPAGFAMLLTVLASSILISIRFRGTFNGGSDYMTVLVLLCLTLSAGSDSPLVVTGCLAYLAIQCVLSYFIAGVSKLRNSNWRSGTALGAFFKSPGFHLSEQNPADKKLAATLAAFPRLCSWGIVLFECLFPLALMNTTVCALFVAIALVFHVLNVFAFGLNRFLWAWSATYPALLWWVSIK